MEAYSYGQILNKGKLFKVDYFNESCFRMENGDLVKVFHSHVLDRLRREGHSLEQRLATSENLSCSEYIAMPTRLIESRCEVIGYVVPEARKLAVPSDISLEDYVEFHEGVESKMKQSGEEGIILTNLSSPECIRKNSDGRILFTNYASLQVGRVSAIQPSTKIGKGFESRYLDKRGNYMSSVDQRNSIFLFFKNTFGVDLGIVEHQYYLLGKEKGDELLSRLFEQINLNDGNIQQKVWSLFHPEQKLEFLGKDMLELAGKYALVKTPDEFGIRKLV